MLLQLYSNPASRESSFSSKEDVREAGKKGLIPPITSDDEVKVATVTQPPAFPDMVHYLHKRVSYSSIPCTYVFVI